MSPAQMAVLLEGAGTSKQLCNFGNCDITREIGDISKMDRRSMRSHPKKRKIRISDVTCPICFSIMIEPVTMPCRHEMCMPCFEKNGSTTSLSCPMCRLRIGAWSRKAAREKTLVNTDLWEKIQNYFPREIEKRLAGEDDDLTRQSSCSVCISEPGEIRKEYEEKLKEFKKEEESLKQEQEKASLELIKKIEEEELKSVGVQPLDVSLLQNLGFDSGSELNKSADLSCSHSNISHTLDTSSGSTKTRSSSVQSDDSISPELHYFKPIRAAPRTPPKQNADGKLIEPSLVCIKPRKLSYNMESFQRNSSLCDIMQDRLNSVKRDRTFRTEPVLSPASSLELTNNASDIFTYPVSPSLPAEDSVPALMLSGSSLLDCPLPVGKNAHLGKANKENELLLNCKNNGKRVLECEHVCLGNGVSFKRLRQSKVQHSSKSSEVSRKMCMRSKSSELKPQSSVVNPSRGKERQEMGQAWRICGYNEKSSSFTKCNSNKCASSASSTAMCLGHGDFDVQSSTASDSKLGNSVMNLMEESHLQNMKARKEQVEDDYVIACRLQKMFDEEANGYNRTASVKSDYNLRKKVRVSERKNRGK